MTKETSLIVFGSTGTGKSTFLNTIVGSQQFKEGDTWKSETKQCQGKFGTFEGRKVYCVDTAGMNDIGQTDENSLNEITNFIRNESAMKCLILVMNYNEVRFDEKLKELFVLINNMYPGKKWYLNFAVVWSQCYDYIPQSEKLTNIPYKKSQLIKFIKNIDSRATQTELQSIPQLFIDSVEARQSSHRSREGIKQLLDWIKSLPTLKNSLGTIIDVNKTIKKSEWNYKTEIVNTSVNGRLKTITKQDYRRMKKYYYNGEVDYSNWECIKTYNDEETLPLMPVGDPYYETRKNTLSLQTRKQIDGYRAYGSRRYGFAGPRRKREYGRYMQGKEERIEKRQCQAMNDGTIRYGNWILESSRRYEVETSRFD